MGVVIFTTIKIPHRMKTVLLFTSVLLLALTACKKEAIDCQEAVCSNQFCEELVFGVAYGMCPPGTDNCSQLYRLTSVGLDEETNNVYPGDANNNFAYRARPASDHSIALPLIQQLPSQLLQQPNGSIGCPDCVDQGTYFIQYNTMSGTQTWRIDTDLNNVPTYLHPYLNQMQQAIDQLF